MVKPSGLWSRPSPFSLIGVRPNSPPQMTSVSSSRPRALRSLSRPAIGLVHGAAELGVVLLDLGVGVPLAARAAVELDEADAALDEAAGEQAVAAEDGGLRLIDAVERLGRVGLLASGRPLRAPRPACGRRVRSCAMRASSSVLSVRDAACSRLSCVEEVELAALPLVGDALGRVRDSGSARRRR